MKVKIRQEMVFIKEIDVPEEEMSSFDTAYDWYYDRSDDMDERVIMTWDDCIDTTDFEIEVEGEIEEDEE